MSKSMYAVTVAIVSLAILLIVIGNQNMGPLKWISNECAPGFIKMSDGDGRWDYYCTRK